MTEIQKRWKKTDQLLKSYLKVNNAIFSQVKDEIIDLFEEYDIEYADLTKTVSPRVKRKFLDKISILLKKYPYNEILSFKINTISKYTYATCIQILLLGIYAKYEEKTYEEVRNIFIEVGKDCYEQGRKDLNFNPVKLEDIITWYYISKLLYMPVYNQTLRQYLDTLCLTNSQKMYGILSDAYQSGDLNEGTLNKEIEKEKHRLVNINGDKVSGSIPDLAITVGNECYLKPAKDSGQDIKAKFIAELDERTTLMCKSLDGQIFNVNGENKFRRYSAAHQNYIECTTQGLQLGVNLPPVTDHFHWCRSTITYIIERYMNIKNVLDEELKNKGNPKDVTKASYWEVDGIKYPLKDKEVFFKEDEIETNTRIANWFTEVTGRPVQLQPVVVKPEKIKTCDFILTDTNTKLELKSFKIVNYDENKNYFDKKLANGYGQANDFIIDITDSPITIEKAIKDIDEVMGYANKSFVKKIYLKSGWQLVGIYERK